ncbi:MAG TPA: winged helix DNA-binding domain-containing protein [Candidatus Dormibacteraeota bacterium]
MPRLSGAAACPSSVALATCGIHAQVMSTADVQVWARSEPAEPGAVARALWEERSLVRTWCMRGTLHLLTPEQLALYSAVFDPAVNYTAVWLRNFQVTAEDLDALYEAFSEALEDGEPRTRRELAEVVTRRAGDHLGDRLRSSWGELLKPAARRGLFVNGPNRGQETTYVRTESWLGPAPRIDPEAARLDWLRRYLRAYGPASPQDYARWLGVRQMGPINALVTRLGPELAEVRVAGQKLLALSADLDELAGGERDAVAAVRLLPAFDTYVLGHADRDHLAGAEHRPLVYRTAGWISPTVLSGGRIVGVWEQRVEGASLAVRVTPFGTLSRAEQAGVRGEAERLAAFFDRRPALYT